MSIPNLSLEGKTALVTGSRRGLGKAIALALAEAGAHVAVCDRVEEEGDLTGVYEAIRGLGRRSLAVRVDLTQKSEVEDLVRQVEKEMGGLDILVNNAGGRAGLSPLLHETSLEDWQMVMDNNLKGRFSLFPGCRQRDDRAKEREYPEYGLGRRNEGLYQERLLQHCQGRYYYADPKSGLGSG